MKPIDTRYQAKRNYFKETGNKVRVPAYQTKFLQPPQVSVAIKPPSLNQKKLKNPLSRAEIPNPKNLWKKELKPNLQQPDKNTTRQISSQDIKDTQDTAKGAVTGFIGNTQNSYLPTISSSQKLTNAIYQGVVKGSSHLIPYIDKSVIEKVLIHYNISEKSDIDRNSIQKLMGVLQNIADRLKQKSLESVPQNTSMGAVSGGQAVNNEMYDRDTKRETYTVCIDSNDRYRQYWPNSNEYQILFGRESSSNSNYQELTFSQDIQRTFHNVEKVILKEVILPFNKNETYHKLPYLLVEIKELGSNFWGSNPALTKSFAKLTVSEQKGDYLYYKVDVNEKRFNPRIELSSLTIRFLDPEGQLIDFGIETDLATGEGDGNEVGLVQDDVVTVSENVDIIDDSEFAAETTPVLERHNLLTFEITCIQRVFQSVFLH